MVGYIYKITNKINGKAYIGKTTRTVQEGGRNTYTIPQRDDVKSDLFIELLESMEQTHLL